MRRKLMGRIWDSLPEGISYVPALATRLRPEVLA